jgi:hypothetical protein
MKDLGSPGCGRMPDPKDCHIRDLSLTREEEIVLTVARLFFRSFAVAGSEAWVAGMAEAEAGLGYRDGPIVAARLLATIQAVRRSRQSVFLFNSAGCPGCSAVATEHERRLMRALSAVRRGDGAVARAEMMMLCEGNCIERVLAALLALGHALDCEARRPPAVHPVPSPGEARARAPAPPSGKTVP